jgi:L-ribulose-5-phosphate 3-epimerase
MTLSRRQLLACAAAAAAPPAAGQMTTHTANGPKLRSTPGICIYSQVMRKVGYSELGLILRDTGLDGINLTVFPGGHVNPANAGLEMFRSVEEITGTGMDIPIISTQYVNLTDPTIREVLGICSEMGVPLFRSGAWHYGDAADPQGRLGEVQRDVAGLASIARAAKMSVAIENLTGDYVGAATWDMNMILRGLDPQSAGWDFDIGNATVEGGGGGWAVALRLAIPRLKAVSVRDFYWTKDGGAWKITPCPLGEGMVDWTAFFSALAKAHFTGPLTIQMDYQPQSLTTALRHEVDFVRKQVSAAYGPVPGK